MWECPLPDPWHPVIAVHITLVQRPKLANTCAKSAMAPSTSPRNSTYRCEHGVRVYFPSTESFHVLRLQTHGARECTPRPSCDTRIPLLDDFAFPFPGRAQAHRWKHDAILLKVKHQHTSMSTNPDLCWSLGLDEIYVVQLATRIENNYPSSLQFGGLEFRCGGQNEYRVFD